MNQNEMKSAFPFDEHMGIDQIVPHLGLTKLEYFTGQALASMNYQEKMDLVHDHVPETENSDTQEHIIARACIRQAKAIIKALDET